MPIIYACILLVTADTHSASFVPDLLDVMAEYADAGDSMMIAGDLVDGPGDWDSVWTRRMDQYGVWAVPGNHDDARGFESSTHMARIVCGDEDEPDFVGFGVDSERVLGGYGSGYRWARENYPETPWVVFTHRPLVSCIHSGGHGLTDRPWGAQLAASLPFGSIVIAGHEHVWCHAHMEGWTQIIVSTGGGKRYECPGNPPGNIACEYLPDHPTFVRVAPLEDDLVIVGVTADGLVERRMSILEGEFPQ